MSHLKQMMSKVFIAHCEIETTAFGGCQRLSHDAKVAHQVWNCRPMPFAIMNASELSGSRLPVEARTFSESAWGEAFVVFLVPVY